MVDGSKVEVGDLGNNFLGKGSLYFVQIFWLMLVFFSCSISSVLSVVLFYDANFD